MERDKLNINKSEKLFSSINENNCRCFKGIPVEFSLKDRLKNKEEVKVDLMIEEKIICNVWGQVIDINQKPVDDALITLLKPKYSNGRYEYIPVATTLSDFEGFYQFEVKPLKNGLKYKVIAGKTND